MSTRGDSGNHGAFVLRLADSNLVLAQRLGEWIGHAPALEEDLGLANTALDLLGQARLLLTYAGALEGRGRDEDALAYLREEGEYLNCALAEQPNGDFGDTLARQFLFDAWQLPLYERLASSRDPQLAAIAARGVKEARYHLRYSSGWVVRLGDGTAESHGRVQGSLERLWPYTAELFDADDIDRAMQVAGIGVERECRHGAPPGTVADRSGLGGAELGPVEAEEVAPLHAMAEQEQQHEGPGRGGAERPGGCRTRWRDGILARIGGKLGTRARGLLRRDQDHPGTACEGDAAGDAARGQHQDQVLGVPPPRHLRDNLLHAPVTSSGQAPSPAAVPSPGAMAAALLAAPRGRSSAGSIRRPGDDEYLPGSK